ncbi:MAG TPA: molybdopterin biosynthesis protein [Methanomicrobiales archaeon]|nr:molybdopterin biosynthesis protein [Methanomicrobiales archaeon]
MVKRYLSLTPLGEAREILGRSFVFTPVTEKVPIGAAAGRITASPVVARFSVPGAHLAAMDGIAVLAEETFGASEQRPVTLRGAVRVNTGNLLPPGCDAVIMIEEVRIDGDRFTIRSPVSPWQHVRPVGEDIGETEMILPSRHPVRPHEIGALAAYGITELEVLTVRIGLIPTGSELVPPGERPGPGQVVESNTIMAAAWLEGLGARCTRLPLTPDEPDLIRSRLSEAAEENDLVIISAGSSAGTRDFTADAIADLGEVLVHGVAMKPGKPVILGRIRGKPVIGLPGYPLSAVTVLRELVTPLLSRYGLPSEQGEEIRATLASTLASELGVEEFVFLSVGRIRDRWVAVPHGRGAGVQMSGVRANAYLSIGAGKEGIEAGEEVVAHLMVPAGEAERALILTGSHDPALDLLADNLARAGVGLHSAHQGSMGGLIALKKRVCHGAPMHLLADDGSYNIPYLSRHISGENLVLLCLAGREQGIISRDGLSLGDLPGARFINRQKGSGTRILLDHLLVEKGIPPASIPGYDRELTTHLAVALAVKTGEADAGLGVYSAAKALGLSFVPVAREPYELVFYADTWEDPRVQALAAAVSSPPFREGLEGLGGYDVSLTGRLRRLPP